MAGLGWSVGVPFIARQTDRGMPRYEAGSLDRFIYNGGQELVPIASSGAGPDMPEGEAWPAFVAESGRGWVYFRARVEGAFMRFFLRDDERQWVVQDTSGTLFVFGESALMSGTEAAVVDFVDGGETYAYRWNLTSVVDRSGNRVEYRYQRDQGQSYLTAISWNNPPGGASDADLASYQHRVSLEYELRPDPYFSYSSGFRVETAQRLTRVFVESVPFGAAPGSGFAHTRTYVLTYDSESYLSLLESVQLLGRGCFEAGDPGCTVEEGGALPAMVFGYTSSTPTATGCPTCSSPTRRATTTTACSSVEWTRTVTCTSSRPTTSTGRAWRAERRCEA
jgi:YD repeat-containing protein